ncbi:MAG: sarcosine oxidase subunit gamma family protein [Roseobacter sp.]|jgi:sarcosine oxidase subunit gamma
MSEPVTALNGATFSDGIADVTEAPIQGMITLRGDLSLPAVRKAVAAVASADVPGPGQANITGDTGVAWMSPDELLVLCPYHDVHSALASLQTALGESHALAVNVSDARASFRIAGRYAREVLGKLCPVNFAPDAFGTHTFRRTRMAQVPAAVWLSAEDTFQIVCFRSQAQYVFDLLRTAAQQGSEVNVFRTRPLHA